jgi:hypothetical protein
MITLFAACRNYQSQAVGNGHVKSDKHGPSKEIIVRVP